MPRRFVQALILTFALAVCAAAQERPLWQIGEFNGSSDEFGTQTRAAFEPGSSGVKGWGATQQAVVPGREDASSARVIRFELPGEPRGAYRLRLGLLITTPRLPVVQVEVNGHRGWFHQRPERDFEEGNLEAFTFPQYAVGSLVADIPAEFLRRGANEISLTAVADPHTAALPGGAETEGGLLRYDALALYPSAGGRSELARAVTSAEATPTVIYKREGGKLFEVVGVVVGWSGLAPKGSVTLSVPGWSRTQEFASEREFGEQRFEFLVPEFAAGARANVRVNAGGRDYDFPQTLSPKRKWTVYMVPHEHLDVGYSDFQTKLAELHSRVVDEALEMSAARPEFRFSLDGYWQAQQFLEGRSAEERRKFYEAVRARKIFVPA